MMDEHECNYILSKFCGAYVCTICNNHLGLARCFCGFGLQPNERLEDDVEY